MCGVFAMSIAVQDGPDHGFRFPALTVCASNKSSNSLAGWRRHRSSVFTKIFSTECNNSATFNATTDCIENRTYSLADTIIKTDGEKGEELYNAWKEDLTLAYLGKCYTLSYETDSDWRMGGQSLIQVQGWKRFNLNPELSQ